jgi:DNA recombination-dependent growth factor C
MGVLAGALTGRRFRVTGTLPEGWQTFFQAQLNERAFREPSSASGKEENEGWVRVQNLLDTDFDDTNQWLFQNYAVFALRVDVKTLPARLLAAHVDKRCRAWAAERGVGRAPATVRQEIKEALETEWLARALPRVAVTEIAWNVVSGTAIVGATSDKVIDRIRKRFSATFRMDLIPWSPLDASEDVAQRETLLASEPGTVGGEA